MSQQVETADPLDPIEESAMTLMEHLIELRTRLMWIGVAVIIATLVAMIFAWDIVAIINKPLAGYIPQAIGPTDNLVVFFKVSLAAGAAVAMPIIMYQSIAFVTPGLYPHERRALIMILPGALVLFATGVVFAFYVMLPPAVRFLQGFGGDQIRTEWTAALYIGFVTRITFWIGVAFQAPLIVGFLARIGLISGSQLLKFWRQAIVFIAIAAAFITPTIDPVNMTIVMGPLIGLYFFSVGVAYVVYRPREPRDFSESFIPDEYQASHDESPDPTDTDPTDTDPTDTDPTDAGPTDAGPTDEDQSDEDQSDEDQPDEDQSDEGQPDEDQSDEGQPDEDQSDADQPDADQPDADQSDADQSDADQSDEDQSDEDQPDEDQSGEDQSHEDSSEEEKRDE